MKSRLKQEAPFRNKASASFSDPIKSTLSKISDAMS